MAPAYVIYLRLGIINADKFLENLWLLAALMHSNRTANYSIKTASLYCVTPIEQSAI